MAMSALSVNKFVKNESLRIETTVMMLLSAFMNFSLLIVIYLYFIQDRVIEISGVLLATLAFISIATALVANILLMLFSTLCYGKRKSALFSHALFFFALYHLISISHDCHPNGILGLFRDSVTIRKNAFLLVIGVLYLILAWLSHRNLLSCPTARIISVLTLLLAITHLILNNVLAKDNLPFLIGYYIEYISVTAMLLLYDDEYSIRHYTSMLRNSQHD